MSEQGWTRYPPPESEEAEPFWEATREGRLICQWCDDCAAPVHYPRAVCPRCLGEKLSWKPLTGAGEVYTFTVLPSAAQKGLAAFAPYVVALVDLDGGPRFYSNVVGCDPDEVRIGMRVELTWEELEDGRQLPLFRPAAG
ncbi:MAG: Zn-ribbon domain-containing OB-fold protein [Acidimicrobiales bacterium]